MIVSAHNTDRRSLGLALTAALRSQGLSSRDAIVWAGAKLYPTLLRREPDGARTTLPNVGWISLGLDTTLEEWAAEVRAKEGA